MGRLIGMVLAMALLAGCAGKHDADTQGAPPRTAPYVVFFGTDDTSLNAAAQQIIQEIAAAVRRERPRRVIVTGYGDLEGTAGAPLGHRRAATVIAALTTAGVDEAYIHEQFAIGLEAETAGIPVHKVTVALTP